MPNVGGKEFKYSAAGKKAAKRESIKTGKPVVSKYARGGSVGTVRGGGAATKGLGFRKS